MRVHVASLIVGYVLAIVTICAIGLWNASRAEEWIGVNTVSRHLSPSRPYNERNWGIFYERHTSEDWGYQVGYYKNSYERTTAYIFALWQPLSIGSVRIGGFLGGGTGYRENKDDGTPRGGLSPLGGGIVSYNITRSLGLNLIAAKSVVGLQIRVLW